MTAVKNVRRRRCSCRGGKLIAFLVVATGMAFASAFAETDIYGNEVFTYTEDGETKTYKFWVSGTKAEMATSVSSDSVTSSGAALATGARSGGSASSSFEARFRTWLESLGTRLNSRPLRGLIMIYR